MENTWDRHKKREWVQEETVRVSESDVSKMERERMHARKVADREPGELSSGSLSEDGSGMSDYVVIPISNQNVSEGEVQKPDSGNSIPKKRKYSPIVWDLDEMPFQSKSASVLGSSLGVANGSKVSPEKLFSARQNAGGLVSSQSYLSQKFPPPPPLPPLKLGNVSPDPFITCQIQPNSSGERPSWPFGVGERVSLLLPSEQHPKSPPPEAESNTDLEYIDGHMQEHLESPMLGGGQELERHSNRLKYKDEEETLPPRHIAASRWADVNSSPKNARSIEDESLQKARKYTVSMDSKDSSFFPRNGGNQGSNLSLSAESADHISERLEGGQGRSRSPDNDRGESSGGSSGRELEQTIRREEEYDRELNRRELMELDEEDDAQDDYPEQISESDSEEEQSPVTQTSPPSPPQRLIDMLQGCRSVDEFERLNRIDEGTYGVVYRARNKKTGEIVALKKVKMEKEREGFPMTSLREINVLLSFHHPSVVDVKEVVVGSNLDSIFMVMEYMEHDLKALLETMKHPFSQSEVKCLMLQLLEGVKYLHDNWVLHRDLKTSNLLLNNKGELKICDFGLARQYGSPLKAYTNTVVTLWYRAPELLLGAKQYSTAIDMWSLGCIMAELLAKEPLFNGKSEIAQLDKIFRTLGTPNEKIWPNFVNLPGVKFNFPKHPYNNLRDKFPITSFSGKPTLSESGFDLLNRLLTYDPSKRITAEQALKHKWFTEVPLPKSKEFMPTYPARNDYDRRKRRLLKSPDPLEEQRARQLQQGLMILKAPVM